ncbi:hypothetical protein KY289_037127 [Solanum tuberosum]|nr:hypothetical protein KY289_037127 [Solanum tuberosum]
MNPINIFPKSISQLSSLTNLHKLSQIRIASTQLIIHHRGARKYSSDGHPPEKPPPEFPAAPQPDKPSESSEIPSAPNDDPTPKTTQYWGGPYGSGATIPQQSSKSKVRQPHGAEVKTPVPPESDDIVPS